MGQKLNHSKSATPVHDDIEFHISNGLVLYFGVKPLLNLAQFKHSLHTFSETILH